jgi:hypothetical protein
MQGNITLTWILDLCRSHNWNLNSLLAVPKTKMYQFAIKRIVSQFAINRYILYEIVVIVLYIWRMHTWLFKYSIIQRYIGLWISPNIGESTAVTNMFIRNVRDGRCCRRVGRKCAGHVPVTSVGAQWRRELGDHLVERGPHANPDQERQGGEMPNQGTLQQHEQQDIYTQYIHVQFTYITLFLKYVIHQDIFTAIHKKNQQMADTVNIHCYTIIINRYRHQSVHNRHQ